MSSRASPERKRSLTRTQDGPERTPCPRRRALSMPGAADEPWEGVCARAARRAARAPRRCGTLLVGEFVEHRVVEHAERFGRRALVVGGGAQGVASEAGDRRGPGALADDVAGDKQPGVALARPCTRSWARGEDVVEHTGARLALNNRQLV